jgi:excisionase family DNA binding protein
MSELHAYASGQTAEAPVPWDSPERIAMTLTEAAAVLGVSPDTLRQQIARGRLKATKLGRDWWVTPKEVERYERENKR